ncbi:vacuolar protein sorting-associated protein 51 homolog isoform X2 [Lathyrus oleraceus]|uniref:Vacuolar protein sorting-associated protein 51 homolog n=2 Tax=Pisum sativum TaxID=3888 RepID=A0A9D5AUK4_PEA|nr:vacuolar protein sorting-associated protein 51 homolog isoform X2 [Pisum sativum]KAI5424912.1 Vacuolar protein sorting-associated protein 51, variant 2 [Pisum sativum]
METPPLDDKARKMRDLLSSFYSPHPSMSPNSPNTISKFTSSDDINSSSFQPDHYMNLMAHEMNLEGLLHKHVEMVTQIKNLDTDLQMLVYENYNKFICATDSIKRMKSNILGMEGNMEQLLDKIMFVQSRSDNVNTSLTESREHIEKLNKTCNLLRKIQFIYDLPDRLSKCIKAEAYADAVRFYTGAMPILKAYGDSSFHDCKQASDEAISIIEEKLQEKLLSDSETTQVRAEAAILLKQLNYPVDNLKEKLLEKLENLLIDIQLIPEAVKTASPCSHEVAFHEFVEAIHAFQVIFPDSETQLVKLARDLLNKNFLIVEEYVKTRICVEDLLGVLRVVWNNVLKMDEVLQESSLSDHSLEAAKVSVKSYVNTAFSYLMQDISDSLLNVLKRDGVEGHSLEAALDASTKILLQGGRNFLQDVRKILDDELEILNKLRELISDWVQEGFQDFFKQLQLKFQSFSGRNDLAHIQNHSFVEGSQGDKAFPGLVLVLAQLYAFVDRTAIPQINEELASSFSPGVGGYEHGLCFVSRETSRKFRSASESFLHMYVKMRTQRISHLLKKRFTTPNWVKHKEPREVHMFVDLFLQELKDMGNEVKEILPHGTQKHHRVDSNGSSNLSLSRSNSIPDEILSRSNTQKGRSQQLFETHLAKLFKQKVEIFTKVEYTQESVIMTMVKLCLKSLQEFVRLQTFNRSGYQQIQVDIQFLRTPLKEIVEDEATMDFLLDEDKGLKEQTILDYSKKDKGLLAQ